MRRTTTTGLPETGRFHGCAHDCANFTYYARGNLDIQAPYVVALL